MEQVTAQKAIELLREIVKGKENFVYVTPPGGTCVYQIDGQPSCLVGHALIKAGYDADIVARLDPDGEHGGIGAGSIPEYLPDVTDAAANIFECAQRKQDDGKPWSVALAAAEAEFAAQGDWLR